MAKILEMPKLSPTMEEGVLSVWHKKEGDPVEVDDLLAEVETDKATMEFRAFDRGTLLKLLVAAGALVKLGQAVAILGAPGEDVTALAGQAGSGGAPTQAQPQMQEQGRRGAESAEGGSAILSASSAPLRLQPNPPPQPQASALPTSRLDRTELLPAPRAHNGGRVLASPYVRKVARERGLDLSSTQGSGPGGRIVAADLETMTPAAAPLARAPQTVGALALAQPEVRPLSMMRKTIARRLTESKKNVPHFYLRIDVAADELVRLRERINTELGDFKVSFNDLLIKACAVALTRVPECNASYTEEAILVHKRVDISVAVAIPDGLVTPVVRNADQKSVVAIARETRDLAARARAKKLRPEEMTDGTFSISNLGMFGIDEFAAVINPPEGAILAVGQLREEPVARDGELAVGKRLAMTLSCDHRVVDGAVGAAFLAELRGLLEHPLRVLAG
jgi:pyruvate dehydrogenase E2 component (dihydrolipoyllysine-residue acetyltransferase)